MAPRSIINVKGQEVSEKGVYTHRKVSGRFYQKKKGLGGSLRKHCAFNINEPVAVEVRGNLLDR